MSLQSSIIDKLKVSTENEWLHKVIPQNILNGTTDSLNEQDQAHNDLAKLDQLRVSIISTHQIFGHQE